MRRVRLRGAERVHTPWPTADNGTTESCRPVPRGRYGAIKTVCKGPPFARGSVARLDEERIPHLESELAETGDPVIRATLRSTREEASRVRDALSSATALENEPHDPSLVELGDTVTVRENGSTDLERFTVVGKLEARLDSTWISVESPLGSALLPVRSLMSRPRRGRFGTRWCGSSEPADLQDRGDKLRTCRPHRAAASNVGSSAPSAESLTDTRLPRRAACAP